MTSLKGFAQLVIRDLDRGAITPERIHGALETIDRQADRLTLLVSRLLDVARLESGRLAIETRPTDLRALVGGIVEAAQRHAPDHQLSVVAPGPVEAEVDAMRIEQVVSNLVDNAIKYSPSGGAVVVELAASGLDLRLAVRDRGSASRPSGGADLRALLPGPLGAQPWRHGARPLRQQRDRAAARRPDRGRVPGVGRDLLRRHAAARAPGRGRGRVTAAWRRRPAWRWSRSRCWPPTCGWPTSTWPSFDARRPGICWRPSTWSPAGRCR